MSDAQGMINSIAISLPYIRFQYCHPSSQPKGTHHQVILRQLAVDLLNISWLWREKKKSRHLNTLSNSLTDALSLSDNQYLSKSTLPTLPTHTDLETVPKSKVVEATLLYEHYPCSADATLRFLSNALKLS